MTLTPDDKKREVDRARDHELRKRLADQERYDLRRLALLEKKADLVRRGHGR